MWVAGGGGHEADIGARAVVARVQFDQFDRVRFFVRRRRSTYADYLL